MPSIPVVMPEGKLKSSTENSDTTPLLVTRPICAESDSVNQMLPSGPSVMPDG